MSQMAVMMDWKCSKIQIILRDHERTAIGCDVNEYYPCALLL